MTKVRIKDIAKKAGVSVGTVDRVLHDRGRVSMAVKQRVKSVMNEMGYKPNFLARSLASKKGHAIAALVPEAKQDQYWQQARLGIEHAIVGLRDYNVTVKLHFYDQDSVKSFLSAAQQLMKSQPSAVLLAPLFLNEGYRMIKHFLEQELPVILINTDMNFPGVLSYIGQNSFQAGKLAARLIDFGLKEDSTVLLLNLDAEHIDGGHLIAKEKGFRTYFHKHVKSGIQIVSKEFSDFADSQATRVYLQELFEEYGNMASIFVTNSRAHRVVDALPKKVLRKISIVGFDLIEPNLRYLRQGSIDFLLNQNPQLQGYWGVMNLVNHLMASKTIPEKQYLPLDVVMIENLEYYVDRKLPLQVVF
ncbi:MAG: LacI family transcriptional regulator [Saprospiraceae bacterium]|nr:LacI family transcriptional regulator [Saprospiraceae bacterium]